MPWEKHRSWAMVAASDLRHVCRTALSRVDERVCSQDGNDPRPRLRRCGVMPPSDVFNVALSGDFKKADGLPTYPHFDAAPLLAAPGVWMSHLDSADPLRADQLEDVDALILLANRFDAGSMPRSGRLGVVARFGVGYDTVDVEACNRAGIALVITPHAVLDGPVLRQLRRRRRPGHSRRAARARAARRREPCRA